MKDKWIKPRHKVARKIIYPLLGLYIKAKTKIKIEKYKTEEKGPYFILYNHQTGYDQFIVALSFKNPVYHVASDDIFSMGFASKVINYLSKPIPIKKNVSDITAVRTCIKVAKEGGTIAIAPEGNRTYSGETCSFNPAIVGLVKMLKLPVLIYKIEGGYNVFPRWADKPRKGKSRAYVSREISKEEIASLSKEELQSLIAKELYNNDYDLTESYKGSKKGEYLERVAYVCPKCGLSTFESKNNLIKCKNCGLTTLYQDDKTLKTSNVFPFNTYLDWYKYQEHFVNSLDLVSQKEQWFYQESIKLYKVIPCKKKILIDRKSFIRLYGNRYKIYINGNGQEFYFEDLLGVSVLGKNKLNVYYKDEVYQIKGDKRFNAVKYLNFYHRYINQVKENGSNFLGL